jgi:D-lactate dehydrogenase (cytochrome)
MPFMDTSSTLPIQNVPPVHYDVTPENLSAAQAELSSVVGSDSINTSQETCAAHSGSRWSSAHPSHKTHLIVYPRNTDHVSSILKICS